MFLCYDMNGAGRFGFWMVPAPAVVEPAPSAAAVSPAAGRPCSSVQSGLPAAAPSDRSAGWSSSTTGTPSLPETLGYLEGSHGFRFVWNLPEHLLSCQCCFYYLYYGYDSFYKPYILVALFEKYYHMVFLLKSSSIIPTRSLIWNTPTFLL